MTDQQFNDIAPFDNGPDFHQHIERLVAEPLFQHAVEWVLPGVGYSEFKQKLLDCHTQEEFQHRIMLPFLATLEAKTTTGVTLDGIDNYAPEKNYVLISNHRDIVLDASFLNLGLVRGGRPTSEVAIGNNLLIFPWIDELVRINKSFIVKRDNGIRGALEAAKHLSAYIHYCITTNHQSLLIAHREGRAKDSNDRTQEGLIKMLTLGGAGSPLDSIREINLLPVSISYEFDPNDYLKVREFLCKRRDPNFKKSEHDDLLSMETGIMQPKGRVHFAMTECINPELDALPQDLNRSEACAQVCEIVDSHIHRNYRIFPINYIAHDMLMGEHRFADQYTEADIKAVNDRIDGQLAKVDLPDITAEEMAFMREMMLTMYANPLKNKILALS